VPIAPEASTNRVEYHRGSLTEWYVNGPVGLEQGFTLADPPAPKGDKPLTLAFAVAGTLTASSDRTGRGALLKRSDGTVALRYSGLTAHDSLGRELQASMRIERDRLLLQVDDEEARYPVVIDPFIQQAKLVASDPEVQDMFGHAVAVSGDTIVVTAPFNNGAGVAYVFVRPAWGATLTENARLIASDIPVSGSQERFGQSVAMSGDTIVVGAGFADVGANADQGSAYVFMKPTAGWSGTLTESAKLTASDGAAFDIFGVSVAIDGDTIVVGADGNDVGANPNQGSAYVFVKPASGWSGALTENARLAASDGGRFDFLGAAVAIHGDTIVTGAPNFFDDVLQRVDLGLAYVFEKPPEGWTGDLIETVKAIPSDGVLNNWFGYSVAVSGDTVVVGAPRDRFGTGAAYAFVRPATGWSGTIAHNAKMMITPSLVIGLGFSTAVTGDTVVVTGDIGAGAWVFEMPAGGWSGTVTEPDAVTASDHVPDDGFGHSVAMGGKILVVGAPYRDFRKGAAYVFSGHEADLSVSKAASPDPVIAGGNLTYAITVANNGPDSADNVALTDDLPPDLILVSCSATGGGVCGGTGNNRTVTFASLAASGSATITIEATVNAAMPGGATVTNTVSATSATSDPNSANNSATVTTAVINQADLAVTKTASPGMAQAGTNVTYAVTAANNGPHAALNVTLTDALPAGLTFVSNSGASGWTCVNPAAGSGGTITCSISSLASGGTATFAIVANVGCGVAAGTVIANPANLSSSTPDPNSSNNAATASVTASNPPPVLTTAVATSVLSPTNMPALVNVGLSASTSDGACAAPAVSSVEVFGDENDEAPTARDEVYSPDAADIGVGTLRLRAERVKNLDGRGYLIVVKAVDAAGSVAFATATVVVPQKPSPASLASVNAQAAAAKSYADAHGGSPPPAFFVIGDGPIIGPLQ
jgi:uncharacterized repeat protein (TIGR01451 family)